MIEQYQYPFDDRKPKLGLVIGILVLGIAGGIIFYIANNKKDNSES
jgi:hypothetical protein